MKLIIKLEKDALDGSFPVSSLLREFIFICSKLGMKDMESWARKEVNGYVGAEDSIPVYRYIQVLYTDIYKELVNSIILIAGGARFFSKQKKKSVFLVKDRFPAPYQRLKIGCIPRKISRCPWNFRLR